MRSPHRVVSCRGAFTSRGFLGSCAWARRPSLTAACSTPVCAYLPWQLQPWVGPHEAQLSPDVYLSQRAHAVCAPRLTTGTGHLTPDSGHQTPPPAPLPSAPTEELACTLHPARLLPLRSDGMRLYPAPCPLPPSSQQARQSCPSPILGPDVACTLHPRPTPCTFGLHPASSACALHPRPAPCTLGPELAGRLVVLAPPPPPRQPDPRPAGSPSRGPSHL